ncbi:28S ribosomal protein S27, mitochondrial [Osmia bicornis bicornis]|uniref:28S ribosomal protein S27, mitochondrial n=1 Tax=Osmia bicornis bicornis TaxID=1437191 RepID=UPI0010F68E1E|nr:28S ribosomal protein S27, mitochondrial [Osmia bicornis bicornis]
MFKLFNSGTKVYYTVCKTVIQKRSFLSEAYRCEEAWKARLEFPLLKKVNPQQLFLTLDQNFSSKGKVSAVDIDIFANTVADKHQSEELLYTLHHLRLSAEATNILESTHHAVIRFLLNHDCTTDLVNILHDRLNYGIFPDSLCYNVLMDTYLKKKDYANAAKIAVLPMLQEDTENPITNALSIYSCHKYLENPDVWQKPPEPVDDSKEEIKVRVKYLRNPYFDDHFDLTDPRDLVGKTLAFQGKAMNNTLGRTCHLRGLILYKKYQDVLKLIQQWKDEVEEDVVYDEVFTLIEKDNTHIPKEQIPNELENLMSEVNALKEKKLCKDNMTEVLENNVKSAVNKQSEIDMNEQLKKYSEWEKQREIVLNKQLEEINRQARIQNINEMKKDLEEREKLLTYFEKEEDMELEIERLEAADKKEMERVLRQHRAAKKLRNLKHEEEYVPPTI